MKKQTSASRLAVGAMLACQIGTVSSNSASAGFLRDCKDWFTDTTNLKWAGNYLLQNTYGISMLIDMLSRTNVIENVKNAPEYIKEKLTTREYISSDDFTESFDENCNSNGVIGLKKCKRDLKEEGLDILQRKEIDAGDDDDGSAEREVHTAVTLITGVDDRNKNRLVKSYSRSLTTQPPKEIDLRASANVVKDLLPSKPDFYGNPGETTPGDDLKKHLAKSTNQVIVFKVTRQQIVVMDALLKDAQQTGEAVVKGEKINFGNSTILLVCKEKKKAIEGTLKRLTFLESANCIDLDEKYTKKDIYDLITDGLLPTINYLEQRGVQTNWKPVIADITKELYASNKFSDEIVQNLADNLRNFVWKNQKVVVKAEVRYSSAKGGFYKTELAQKTKDKKNPRNEKDGEKEAEESKTPKKITEEKLSTEEFENELAGEINKTLYVKWNKDENNLNFDFAKLINQIQEKVRRNNRRTFTNSGVTNLVAQLDTFITNNKDTIKNGATINYDSFGNKFSLVESKKGIKMQTGNINTNKNGITDETGKLIDVKGSA